MKLKLRKLNTRGFSHDITLVVFVAIFAIAGVGYMVASYANPVSKKSVSGAASGAKSPVLCAVSNVPANPKAGDVIRPSVTFKNRSKQAQTFTAGSTIVLIGSKEGGGKGGSVTQGPKTLSPGKSIKLDTGLMYTVSKTATKGQKASFQVYGSVGQTTFKCSKTARLPYV